MGEFLISISGLRFRMRNVRAAQTVRPRAFGAGEDCVWRCSLTGLFFGRVGQADG